MREKKRSSIMSMAILGGIVVAVVMVIGTLWMGQSSRRDTEKAVRSVSTLYLDELAGRREQVVADNLMDNIEIMQVAIGLMTKEDLSDSAHLRAYQSRMKLLFNLEKFAFVNTDGLLYTSLGVQDGIDQYSFDFRNIQSPEISLKNLDSADKKVVIAIPVDQIPFEGTHFVACFMEIDMQVMLRGVSMQAQNSGATFSNIYTRNGESLTNNILGGQAPGTNILEALGNARFEDGYSLEQVINDFSTGNKGVVSFIYGSIPETLSYTPIDGTDWFLTYLIRESVISEQISNVTSETIRRSIIQSVLITAVLLGLFCVIILQNRKSVRIAFEKEKAETENRVKQEELERRITLQEKLLEQERQQARQNNLINALASDYRSVYYLELDKDEGICYQPHTDLNDRLEVGEHFPYLETMTAYAGHYISEPYRAEFLNFIRPESIRAGLASERVISYRYVVHRHGQESYEMIRFAGVYQPGEQEGQPVQTVGACFTDIDAETRRSLEQREALSNALTAAEEANKAKTAFLSNMSHEIRTPMNAIIGLNNIALNDAETPEKTRGYLRKIGESAEHLLNLINDILDMSRIESGRMTLRNEEFSFSKLIEAVNILFAEQCQEKGLEYHCHIKGQLDDFYIGDNMKLRQVLINILGNAVKFTPPGGRVELCAERTAQFDGKSTICFVISDTGIGMSTEFLPHIFDTFSQEDSTTTTRYGSSGLGMAITKSIVEMMNGTIEVESEKGKGTAFTVTVTLMDSSHHACSDEGPDILPQDMCVLVVDDDPVACEHARLVLEKAGIAAETAESGEDAIEMVELRHARRAPYNLILVDWKMPGIDGVETTRRIRKIVGNDSAIIILTAYRWDDVLEEAMKAGVDSFLSKPLFAASVVEEYHSALKRKNIPSGKSSGKAELSGRRILLAEDMAVNAEIMLMILQTRDIQAEHAENGKIAVEMFANHDPGYYDAILMDMRMPEMDGLEATKTIRAMDRPDAKKIPIIALTANAFDEDVQRSLQAGLNAHLSKPVDPDNLFDTIAGLIGN